ncbi:MAG: rod shape-determining protein RodA [Thermodesulfovibrionales bacterium]|nr:rod shape-determining protein RodA [Thermodesulfovibrionales bacterium]
MLKIDRRLISHLDYLTFGIVLTLSIIGILTIYSATRPPVDIFQQQDFYLKQTLWLLISVVCMLIVLTFDYIWLQRFAYVFYIAGLIALILVFFIGKTTMGAQRWISIGPLNFQPSEFFRLAFIIAYSAYLSNIKEPLKDKTYLKSALIFALFPFILLIKQPDLGTSILLFCLFVILSIIKGINKKLIVTLSIIAIVSVPFLGDILWDKLKDYQKSRLTAFINPEEDTTGAGYHIYQSKISVGSGGFTGKGYLKGTQGPLRFLPEKHTDFIFSVYAEETGFLGSLFLIALYLILFLRGIDTALKAKDEFGRLVATGITAMFFIYFTVNVGMTIGILPVVGVPLPFVSYGGTALLSNFISAGILISIRTRRYELFYP